MRQLIFTALIMFSLSGVTVTAQEIIPGAIKFKPEKIDIHSTHETTCSPRKVVVTNGTDAAIKDPAFRITGSQAFSIQRHFQKCPNPLGIGQKCKIYINFCPQITRTFRARLIFQDNLNQIEMTGRGVARF
jgi:hypothetical protein